MVEADHTYALQADGAVSISGINGIALTGNLGYERNTGTTAVTRQITVGGTTRSLDVAPGAVGSPFNRIGGQNVTLALAGQQLTGDFTGHLGHQRLRPHPDRRQPPLGRRPGERDRHRRDDQRAPPPDSTAT